MFPEFFNRDQDDTSEKRLMKTIYHYPYLLCYISTCIFITRHSVCFTNKFCHSSCNRESHCLPSRNYLKLTRQREEKNRKDRTKKKISITVSTNGHSPAWIVSWPASQPASQPFSGRRRALRRQATWLRPCTSSSAPAASVNRFCLDPSYVQSQLVFICRLT